MTTEADEFAQFAATLPAPQPDTDVASAPQPEAKKDEPLSAEDEAAMAAALRDAGEKPPEKPSPEAKAEKEDEDKTDWAAIAAKERAKREARGARKAAEAAQQAEIAELKRTAAEHAALLALAKDDPVAALKKVGTTYDAATEKYLADLEKNKNLPPPPTDDQKKIAELEAWKQEQIKKAEAAELAQQQARRDETLRDLNGKAAAEIAAKGDEYEMLAAHPKGTEAVIKLLIAHHHSTTVFSDDGKKVLRAGETLDMKTACERIEKVLRDSQAPFAKTKFVRALVEGKSPTTLSSDMREAGNPGTKNADEDKDFLENALRLSKQFSPQ